jgi:hypothetical protein
MSAAIKNLEQELADHEKLHQSVEAAIEQKLKEFIDYYHNCSFDTKQN